MSRRAAFTVISFVMLLATPLVGGVGFIADLAPGSWNASSEPRIVVSSDRQAAAIELGAYGRFGRVHLASDGSFEVFPYDGGLWHLRASSTRSHWYSNHASVLRFDVASSQVETYPTHAWVEDLYSLPSDNLLLIIKYLHGSFTVRRTSGDGQILLVDQFSDDTFSGAEIGEDGFWIASERGIWRFSYDGSPGVNEFYGDVRSMTRLPNGSFILGIDTVEWGTELHHWNPGSSPSMIADLNPGPASSFHRGFGVTPSGHLLFSADDGVRGLELWMSDGTAEGTYLVHETIPGEGSEIASTMVTSHDAGLLSYAAEDGRGVLLSLDGAAKNMWVDRAAGAISGAQRNPDGSVLFIREIVRDLHPKGRLHFRASAEDSIHERLQIGGDSAYSARELHPLGDRFVVPVSTAATGEEPWLVSADGTSATLVSDFVGVTGDSSHPTFIPSPSPGVSLFFTDSKSADHEVDFWRTDGTSDGTTRVEGLQARPNGSYPQRHSKFAHDGFTYIRVGSPWWRTDGTRWEEVPVPGQYTTLHSTGSELYAFSATPNGPRLLYRYEAGGFSLIYESESDISPLDGSEGRLFLRLEEGIAVLERGTVKPKLVYLGNQYTAVAALRGRLLIRSAPDYALYSISGSPGEAERIGDVEGDPAGVDGEWAWFWSANGYFRTDGTVVGTIHSSHAGPDDGYRLDPVGRRAIMVNTGGTYLVDPPAAPRLISDQRLLHIGSAGRTHLLSAYLALDSYYKPLWGWTEEKEPPYPLGSMITAVRDHSAVRYRDSIHFAGFEQAVGTEPAAWRPESADPLDVLTITPTGCSTAEGSTALVRFTFDPIPDAGLSLAVTTVAGSASHSDYEPLDLNQALNPGQREVVVEVRTQRDLLPESEESFVVRAVLSNGMSSEATVNIYEPLRSADVALRALPDGRAEVLNRGPYLADIDQPERQFLQPAEITGIASLTPDAVTPVASDQLHVDTGQPDPHPWNQTAARWASHSRVDQLSYVRIPCGGMSRGLSTITFEAAGIATTGTRLRLVSEFAPASLELTGPFTTIAVSYPGGDMSAKMAIHGDALVDDIDIPVLDQPCRTVWPAAKADPIYNGRNDLLARDRSTGSLIWYGMTGTRVSTTHASFGVSDFDWQPEALGDFNGDFRPDLVWRNYATGAVNIWFMDGTRYIAGAPLFSVADPAWKIEAASDFNNDGNTDLIWRNYTTGDVNIWYLDGTQYISGANLFRVADPNWEIRGADDFNFDGQADLMWRNRSTGDVNVWYLHQGTWYYGENLFNVTDPQWEIVAVGDYDGDGLSDLIWQHEGTGSVNLWRLDGARYLGGAHLFTTAHRIVAPR